jgi:uncharacterized membrane protein
MRHPHQNHCTTIFLLVPYIYIYIYIYIQAKHLQRHAHRRNWVLFDSFFESVLNKSKIYLTELGTRNDLS